MLCCVSLPCQIPSTLQLLFYTQSMLIMGPVYDATHDASKAYNVRWRVASSSTRRLALASRLLMLSLMLSLLLALLSLMLMPSCPPWSPYVPQAGVMSCFLVGVMQLVSAPFAWTLSNSLPKYAVCTVAR